MPSGWEGLTELLAQCVVRVTTPFGQGTGFVVRAGLVLTCRHVVEHVKQTDDIELRDHLGRTFPARWVVTVPEGTEITEVGAARWPDLALLRMQGQGYDLPAVVLDNGTIGPADELAVAGYPAGAGITYQTRAFTAGFTTNRDDAGHSYVRIDDDSIDPGLSGGPVLTKKGFVCGYVRLTMSANSTLGGFIVPISEVLHVSSELKHAFDDPGETAAPWIKLLGGLRMKEFDRDDQGRRFDRLETARPVVNIEVLRHGEALGPVAAWEVRAIDQPVMQRVTTADLGEGVLEAVDHWSRRHTIVSKDQVELLGHVLYRALLPQPISQLVEDHRNRGDSPLVRLKVSKANMLSAIPWEYATSPDGMCLSIADDMTFSRYVDVSSGVEASSPVEGGSTGPKRVKKIRALVVVNGPEDATKAQELAGLMGSRIPHGMTAETAARLDLTIRSTMYYDEFAGLLEEGPWHVIHYLGSTWSTASLSFADLGGAFGTADMVPVPLATFAAAVHKTDAQVVVLQLQPPRSEPLSDSSAFLSLLDKRVGALVLAEHAATPAHVLGFATAFYNDLAQGRAVEAAVQAARRRLANAPPMLGAATWLDYAAFGSISVTTTPTSDLRLLPPLRDKKSETRGLTGGARPGSPPRPERQTTAPTEGGSFEVER